MGILFLIYLYLGSVTVKVLWVGVMKTVLDDFFMARKRLRRFLRTIALSNCVSVDLFDDDSLFHH